MGYNVGMPTMKLDRCNHFGKQKEHIGNARAVACEGLSERHSSDDDLDKSKTCDNIFLFKKDKDASERFKSGEDLCDYWERMADEYRVIDKNGKEKKLRYDAGIGFAGICKPDDDFMKTLTREQQKKFFMDSISIISDIYEQRGMVMDVTVIHFDEAVPHMHYYGHDPEYKVAKKLGLPLYKALNDTEYPKRMREKGWDVNSLKGYDVEKAKGMSEDELKEYKAQHRAKRKGGKSASVYKAQKRKEELDAKEAGLDGMAEGLRKQANELSNRELALDARETALKRLAEELSEEKEKSLKMANTASQMQSDAEQLKLQYEKLVETEKQQLQKTLRAATIVEESAKNKRNELQRRANDLDVKIARNNPHQSKLKDVPDYTFD